MKYLIVILLATLLAGCPLDRTTQYVACDSQTGDDGIRSNEAGWWYFDSRGGAWVSKDGLQSFTAPAGYSCYVVDQE